MEDKSTFDGTPFIITGIVVVFGYLIGKAVIDGIREAIANHPSVIIIPSVLFVIGTLVTIAWVSRDYITRNTSHVTDAATASQRTPVTGREFVMEITISVPTTVTAVHDTIQYRFKRNRTVEVFGIKEGKYDITRVDWQGGKKNEPIPDNAKIETKSFEIRMQETLLRVLDFSQRGFYKEDFSSFTGETYDDILHAYSSPSPTPEEGL